MRKLNRWELYRFKRKVKHIMSEDPESIMKAMDAAASVPKPPPLPMGKKPVEDPLSEGDITRFQKHAKDLGYEKIKTDSETQIQFQIVWLSFCVVLIGIWLKWLVTSTATGMFIWDLTMLVDAIYYSVTNFSQLVIGKIIKLLSEKLKKKTLFPD